MFDNLKRDHGDKPDRDILLLILAEQLIINQKLDKIMSTQTELAQQLTDQGAQIEALTTQVQKIGAEEAGLQKAVADLTAELANQENVSPALQAAADAVTAKLANLSAAIKGVDDQVPDSPAA